MSLNHFPKIINDGLILYFDAKNPKCYPSSGTAISDLAKAGEVWNLSGDATVGQKGIAFPLNTNAKSATTTASFSLGSSGSLTYSWWCKLSNGGSTYPSLFYDRAQGVTPFAWIYVDGTTLTIQASNGSTVVSNSSPIFTGFMDTWINVAITYVYSSTASIVFYRNGQAVTTVANAGIRLFPDQVTQKKIGCYSTASGHNWAGEIGPFALYNRALTQPEILQNYEALKGRFEN